MPREDRTSTIVLPLLALLVLGFVLWHSSRPVPPQPTLEPDVASTLPTRELPTCKVPAEATPAPPTLEVGQMGTIVSITAYITDFDLSDNKASAGAYDPEGNLLGVTIEKGQGEMQGGGEWVTFVFATPLDVSNYEQVRLAVFGNFEEVGYVTTGPDVTFDTNAVYTGIGSWPSYVDPPEEFGWFEENKLFSIYGTGGNGERIGNQSASETGFYMEGEKVCATGLLDTEPLEDELKISGSDSIALSEILSGHGPGISAHDTIVLGEHARHGGLIAPCAGRYIEPEPEEHQANPYRHG